MLKEILQAIFSRDLNKLKAEIAAYKSEEKIWVIEKEIANSAGNLCLHLVGNLNAFIGAELGNSGYIRNRPNEFAIKDIPQQELIKMVDDTIPVVVSSINHLSDADMDRIYPQIVLGEKHSVGYFLVHLATHLTYHLGQINYHRRLIDEDRMLAR